MSLKEGQVITVPWWRQKLRGVHKYLWECPRTNCFFRVSSSFPSVTRNVANHHVEWHEGAGVG